MRPCSKFFLALVLALGPASLAAQEAQSEARPTLALMGTIPIYWGEAEGLDEVLSDGAPAHWARAVIEREFAIQPLDYLSEEALAGQGTLLLAQPRGLTSEENVALDAWVRQGGRVLLFADPMMTGESRFHIGDRRRPQDVALLSPILARWGVELTFDMAQQDGLRFADHFGDPLPVNMRGEWRYAGQDRPCTIPGDGLLAHCRIGQGQALLVADAAILDINGPHDHAEAALAWLLRHGLGIARENPPVAIDSRSDMGENEGIAEER